MWMGIVIKGCVMLSVSQGIFDVDGDCYKGLCNLTR